jgi:hypothetical protein
MQKSLNKLRLGSAALLLAALLVVSMSPTSETFAQSASEPTAATLSESTIKALQEALNKQGINVKMDGVLNDETRNALRNFQSKHHLPVTGEADKATLDKLGVVAQLGTAAGSPSTVGQAASPSTPSPQAQTQPGQGPRGMMSGAMMQPGQGSDGMMSGPMMQGMMQGMMQTMQGMMRMMHGQMQPGQMRPGQMQRGPMQMPQDGTTMNCPMMSGSDQESAPAMMQMMQGMMQMMQAMHSQMQPGQKPQGAQ